MPRRTIGPVTILALVLTGCQKESPANASPVVTLSRDPDGLAIAGVTAVAFSADARDADSDVLTLSWEFGDGQTASGASVLHVYATEGVFAVSLTVKDGRGGVATAGSSVTVGGLGGRWLLSEGGERFYEWGFDITQAGATLGGRPYSVPDRGCLGDIHGRATTPRAVSFTFKSCDGQDVVIDGTASGDLRSIWGTFRHPDEGTLPIVLSRQ